MLAYSLPTGYSTSLEKNRYHFVYFSSALFAKIVGTFYNGNVAHLALTFLGTFRITLDSLPVTRFRSNKNEGLLVYLALQSDRLFPREVLTTLFWPEESESDAHNNLRQAIYQLRKVLGDLDNPDSPYLLVTRQTVQFNGDSDYALDVRHFKQSIDRGDLEPAVALYHGDLLPGFTCDSLEFEDWLRHEREHLHQLALEAMFEVTEDYLQSGLLDKAQVLARKQLILEPWREQACRQLMRAFALAGDRSSALSQYEQCRQILGDELGVEPAAETVALYERIKAGDFNPTADESFEPAIEVRHHLPTFATPFIGRETELAMLDQFIADPDVRLVTILGPGGIGKTRLATAAAERALAAGSFTDGLYFVDLAPIEEANQIQHAIADAMNFPLQGGDSSSRQQLINYLSQKKMVLLLDNFEHLLDGGSLVGNILQAGPKLKILATSRERLQLQLEHVYPIEGLASPDWDKLEDATQYSAVRLFLQSAQRNQPDFAIRNDHDLTYLTRICRMVAGMPLALELAASWVDMLTLDEIASELQHGLDILETELRDVPERQRSMRASFDNSWRKLNEEERSVFAQLSIFRGGFTRAAAQEVTGASLRQLSHLVNKSLLRFDKENGRYGVHELLRQYGAEKLDQQPELGALATDHHSSYYLQMLAGYTDDLKSKGKLRALITIEADLKNVQLAWNHASAQQNIKAISQSLEALWRFHWDYAQLAGVDFEKAVADLRKCEITSERGNLLGRLLAPLGRFYANAGKKDKAKAVLEESLDLLQRFGTEEEILTPLLFFAEVQDSIEESNRIYREGLVLAKDIGDPWAIGHALVFLGNNSHISGDYARAEQQFREALQQFRQNGDAGGIAYSLNRLSLLAIDMGRYEEAYDLAQETSKVSQSFHNAFNTMGYNALSRALQALGEYEKADESHRRVLKIAAEVFDDAKPYQLFYFFGESAYGKYDYALAIQKYQQSLEGAVENKDLNFIINNHNALGRIAVQQGNGIEARQHFHIALQTALQVNLSPVILDCLAPTAELFAEEGDAAYAVFLSTLISNHPASRAKNKERGERLLVRLEKDLPSGEIDAVRQRSRTTDLNAVASQLLLELQT